MAGAPRMTIPRMASATSCHVCQPHLDRLRGEPRLVEQDDRTVLDAGDPVRRERG